MRKYILEIKANNINRAFALARMETRKPKSEVYGFIVTNVKRTHKPFYADDKSTYIATVRERK